MVSSHNTRKRFSLVLNFPPLYKSSDAAHRPDDSDLRSSLSASPRRTTFFPILSPRPPATLHLKQEQPPLPLPLTDSEGLDPSEKMKLVRKNRKLSRLFGEVPHPIPISVDAAARPVDVDFDNVPEEPGTSTSASSSLGTASSSIRKRKPSLKRCATATGYPSSPLPPQDLHRSRSFGIPASITIPPAAITTRGSPVSPIKFTRPHTAELVPPLPSSPAFSSPPTDATRTAVESTTKRDSTTSSVLVPDPEQIKRARVAKLARQLGEAVPPEILVRASSPRPRTPLASPSGVSFAEIQDLPTHHAGSVGRPSTRRRLSLDLRAFARGNTQPLLTDSAKEKALKRSRSGRKARAQTSGGGNQCTDNMGDAAENEELGSEDDIAMTEKQRVLNVKRARKMNQVRVTDLLILLSLKLMALPTQLFGNDPPPALFQITNISPRLSGGPEPVVSSPLQEAAAMEHISPQLSGPATLRNAMRDSRGTVSSGDASPLVFAEVSSLPPSRATTPQAGRADLDTASDMDVDPDPPSMPDPRTKSPSIKPSPSILSVESTSSVQPSLAASCTSVTPLHSPLLSPMDSPYSASDPTRLLNPMPFSTMFIWDPPAPLPAPAALPEPLGMHPSDPDFRARRMRAAKLSRFFGVGLHEVAEVLPTATSQSPVESRHSEGRSEPRRPSQSSTREARNSESAGGASLSRMRTSSSGKRSRSIPRRQSIVPPLPSQSVAEQTEVKSERPTSSHRRKYSTTAEAFGEGYGALAFLESRKSGFVHELEMQDVIKQLRKIK